MICPAIAIASSTSARKIQSWKAIWCAASDASPKRAAITAPASMNAAMSAAVRTKMYRPTHESRRIEARCGRSPAARAAEHDDHERGAHAELRDHRPPRGALDPPVEAVDEEDPRMTFATLPATRITSGVRRSVTPRR